MTVLAWRMPGLAGPGDVLDPLPDHPGAQLGSGSVQSPVRGRSLQLCGVAPLGAALGRRFHPFAQLPAFPPAIGFLGRLLHDTGSFFTELVSNGDLATFGGELDPRHRVGS